MSMRGSGLMRLLGAGASAAAGVPTAWDMIWEFKQQLYVSQRRASPKVVADLANPVVQRELQAFIDALEKYPKAGSPDEYAALFEATYANESDRRTYIAAKLSGAKPSYGHIALATLMKAGRARLVWTTNFDTLVADACAKVYDGTGVPHVSGRRIGPDRSGRRERGTLACGDQAARGFPVAATEEHRR